MKKRVSDTSVFNAVKYIKEYCGFKEVQAIGILLIRILDILEKRVESEAAE